MSLPPWLRNAARSGVSTVLGTYETRILVGLCLSLGVVLAVFHAPLSLRSPQVGWQVNNGPELISLSEVETADDASEGERAANAPTPDDAPAPTRHDAPRPDANARSTASSPRSARASDASDGSSDTYSRPPVSMTALQPEQQPEILGGIGALYLSIEYPQAAQEAGIEGLLVLNFTVEPSGQTRNIDVVQSLHPLCDSAAVRALRSVRFAPGTRNGDKVPVRMNLPVRFRLVDGVQTASTEAPSPSARKRND